MIYELDDLLPPPILAQLRSKDENGRSVNLFELNGCSLQKSLYYPNTLIRCQQKLFNPVRESVMSIPKTEQPFGLKRNQAHVCETPVFFFLYNTDNYYHFIYDTLPYIMSYNIGKQIYKNLKLLMYYPNPETAHYDFVVEFLALCGVREDDIIIADENTLYDKMLFSSSYTQDGMPNSPPREEVYILHEQLAKKWAPTVQLKSSPKKIYVSRRSWVHDDTSNIGTDYTTRRQLENESELVLALGDMGFTEVFTELMTTQEKMALFYNAEHVVGCIGGGLANVMFSPPETRLDCIVSPGFFDVNERFKFSLQNVDTRYFHETEHVNDKPIKKFMRVKLNGTDNIGEVHSIRGDEVVVKFAPFNPAGWNNRVKYEHHVIPIDNVTPIEKGLNCEWTMDIDKFLQTIES